MKGKWAPSRWRRLTRVGLDEESWLEASRSNSTDGSDEDFWDERHRGILTARLDGARVLDWLF